MSDDVLFSALGDASLVRLGEIVMIRCRKRNCTGAGGAGGQSGGCRRSANRASEQWRQRLERAQYQVDQARRRYASTEPENWLVARTLERDWEAALAEHVRLTAEHERFRRQRPQSANPAELAAIRQLTTDLPALWRAPTATNRKRQRSRSTGRGYGRTAERGMNLLHPRRREATVH